jgi:hypothetical protein
VPSAAEITTRGHKEIVAEDVTKVETLLENGNKSRAGSSTLMNSTSSRPGPQRRESGTMGVEEKWWLS